MSNPSRVIVWIVLLATLVVLLLLFLPWGSVDQEDSSPVPGTVKSDVEVPLGAPAALRSADLPPPTAASPESYATTPTNAHYRLSTQVSESSIQPQASALRFRIVDALGDPIRAGHIEIDNKPRSFANGQLFVPSLSAGSHLAVCEADGYAAATETVKVPSDDEIVFMLEYLCRFDLVTYLGEEMRRPVEGAEIILWKGPSIRRPVGSTTTFPYLTKRWNRVRVDLRRDEDGIRVTHAGDNAPSVSSATPLGLNDLEKGDTILGISGCMWRTGDSPRRQPISDILLYEILAYEGQDSRRLRIWDALSAYSDSEPAQRRMANDYVEFQQGPSKFHCLTRVSFRREITAATATTDSAGKCRFENLPAGVYIAQARKGKYRSPFETLHPARRGARLYLSGVGEARVRVRRAGIDYLGIDRIPGASVRFKPLDEAQEKALYIGRTNAYGLAKFPSLPWGDYDLIVTPPPDIIPSTPKTIRVSVEEPQQYFEVEFAGTGRTVSGKVLREDTKYPVEGFGLELERLGEGLHGPYGRTRSDTDGRFTFSGVMDGEYRLSALMDRRYYTGYALSALIEGAVYSGGGNVRNADKSKESGGSEDDSEWVFALDNPVPGLTVSVAEDIYDIEYYVVPAVHTRFLGTVTTSDGVPVPGARLSASVVFLEPNPITDEEGRFELTVVSRPSKSPHVLTINATVEEQPQQIFEDPRPLMRGSTEVPAFAVGDTISDIQIVMEEIPREGKIIGTIETEDGEPPPGNLQIMTIQNSAMRMSKPDADGSFCIEGLGPGEVVVWFNSPLSWIQSSRYGERPAKEYCSERVDLEIPENQEPQSVSVKLTKAIHLAGVVLDASGNPLILATVAVKELAHSFESITDEEGLFWLFGLDPGMEYTLEVTLDGTDEPVMVLEKVKPPDEDMVIRLK
ncbi:MAG: hypothetical protein ABIH23_17535 [bacterium]